MKRITKPNHTCKIVFLLIAIMTLTSCGYTSTEKDKYPEMAIFPKVDGNGIQLKK